MLQLQTLERRLCKLFITIAFDYTVINRDSEQPHESISKNMGEGSQRKAIRRG